MAVAAYSEYVAEPRDVVANFHGKQLVYVSWDRHLLFAAPFLLCLPPDTLFGDMVKGPLTELLKADPDAAAIDWAAVEWRRGAQAWTPDFNATLAENGIAHKTQLRFRTPGPNTLLAKA